MRFVEFSPRAERVRTEASIPLRRRFNRAIRAIAEQPAWGGSSVRVPAPGHSPNMGLVADLAVRGWAIIYRVRAADNAIWIEDIREIMIG
jgi:hypothetical protein